jgi:solute carrier family 50 protein (sugar transporter)
VGRQGISVEEIADELTDKLTARAMAAKPLRPTGLEGVTLGKTGTRELVKATTGAVIIPFGIFLYSSPLPVMLKILREKSTSGYSFMPYLVPWCNSFTWCVFCFHRGIGLMYEVFTCNVYGLVVYSAILAIYWWSITDPAVRRSFRVKVPLTLLVMVGLAAASALDPHHVCTDPTSLACWYGKVVIVVNCALFGGVFDVFGKVWRTKSVEFLPLLPSISGLAISSDCTAYFICLRDINGLIPNMLGVVFSVVQLIFYAYIANFFPQTWRSKNETLTSGGMRRSLERLLGESQP